MPSILARLSNEEYIIGIVMFLIVSVVLKLINQFSSWKTLPPGPWGLPVVGYLPFLGKFPHKKLTEISKTYGPIYTVKLGQWTSLVLNDYEVIYEALQKHSAVFAGRPPFYSFSFLTKEGSGMAFMPYSPLYKLQRRCAVECINLFIKNKDRPIEELILTHATNMVENLIEQGGKTKLTSPHAEVKISASSMIFDTCYGATDGTSTRDSNDFLEYLEGQRVLLDQVGAANTVDMMPWTKIFVNIKGYIDYCKKEMALSADIEARHLNSYDPNHIRDCMDAGISVSRSVAAYDKEAADVDDEDIRQGIHDLVGAGIDTVPTTIEWAVMFFAAYPEVQQILQQEVDDVIGCHRIPTYEDSKSLPNLEATVYEIWRYSSILPTLLPHYSTKDTMIRGYNIPKGTLVLANAYGANHDDKLWKNPYEFDPSRFMDKNGKIISSLTDKVIVFGLGKRRCPGEFVAKMEVFLFLAVMLQKCSFKKDPSDKWDWDGISGLTLWPQKFKVFISSRN